MNGELTDIGRRVLSGESIGRLLLRRVVELGNDHFWEVLYWANEARQMAFGNTVRLCSIVAGKLGACSEDCQWCAQSLRSSPGVIPPQRTSVNEIVARAREAGRNGVCCFGIVNSGRRPGGADIQQVIQAAHRIQECGEEGPIRACPSLGELTESQARELAAAGFTRYHHNLETSRSFYPNRVTTHSYDDRLATLAAARQAGLQLCCGGLLGIGESWDDRIDLALVLRDEVRPAVSPLNFLHPIAGTPLEKLKPLTPREILLIIAVFRLSMPKIDIKIAGGRCNLREMQSWMFFAGASSLMVGDYLTTVGRSVEEDLRMITDLGLQVGSDYHGKVIQQGHKG